MRSFEIRICIFRWILPKKYKSIDGKICLITGAARGIGRMMSIEFAKKGAVLVLWDINSEGDFTLTISFAANAAFSRNDNKLRKLTVTRSSNAFRFVQNKVSSKDWI